MQRNDLRIAADTFAPTTLVLALALAALAGCQEYNVSNKPDPPVDTTPPTTEPPPQTTPPPVLQPDIEVTPLTVDFGFWPPACTSDRQMVTIANVGEAALEVSSIEISDDAAAVYRMLGGPGTVAPGDAMTVELDFTPVGVQRYDGVTVRVWSNDPDETLVEVGLTGEGAEEGTFVDRFQQNPANLLDILWVIDNSGSMSGEVDNLANTFDVFISGFVALGLDYQIGVVTTDMYDPTQSGRLQGSPTIITPASADPVADFARTVDLGTSGSGNEQGLDAAYAALSSPLIDAENLGMVRPGSNLSIIVVSDEDDSSNVSPTTFASWLEAYQGDPALASFSAVAGPTGGLLPCFALFSGVVAEPAPTYWSAVRNSGGVQLSICDMDMSDILSQLALVSSGLLTTFPLTFVPTAPADIVVTVDGVVVPHGLPDGATYDAATNAVVLNGASVPRPGQSVEVSYETEAECPN